MNTPHDIKGRNQSKINNMQMDFPMAKEKDNALSCIVTTTTNQTETGEQNPHMHQNQKVKRLFQNLNKANLDKKDKDNAKRLEDNHKGNTN